MASEKILEQKKAVVADLADKMGRAVSGVLVKYQGITVEDDTKLRAALRKAGVEYAVIKNSLIGRAADELIPRGDRAPHIGDTLTAYGGGQGGGDGGIGGDVDDVDARDQTHGISDGEVSMSCWTT